MQPEDQAAIDPVSCGSGEDARAQAAGLIRDGRMQDAAALLAQGSRLFPDDMHILLDQASLMEALGDQEGAIGRLETVIDRHPATQAAYRRAGDLCRKAERPHDAELFLLEGMSWFPSDAGMVADYAAIAYDRQDWLQAARRHRLARERFPSLAWPHAGLADALRKAKRPLDAEQALLQGQQHVPHDAHFALEHAELAAEREDWTEAARRFEAAKARFSEFWWAYKRHADVLKRAGRTAEAEAVLLDGQRVAPGEPALFFDHAELAFERQDWAEAVRRFVAARARFPDEWWPAKRIADACKASGRADEAETVLLDAQLRFPREPAFLLDHAELAVARRDLPEALRRFEIVRDRFPDMWWPLRRVGQTLQEMDRSDEADRVVLEGMRLFPHEPVMFFDHANLARGAGRGEEALERFKVVRERFPENYWGWLDLSHAFTALGRRGEAEATLIEMIRAFPDESGCVVELVYLSGRMPAELRQIPLAALADMVDAHIGKNGETLGLLLARAHLAHLQGDYLGQMRQLVRIDERHPDVSDVKTLMAAAREILLGSGETVPGDAADVPLEPSDAPTTPQDLVGRFESLGGGGPDGSTTLGCEFGFLQRNLKIEPLSLLRWIGVTLPDATRLLENDFEGIGNPDMTVLTAKEAFYDWHVVDTAYGLHCDHSHLDRLSVPEAEARKMMCERSRFLARKLREDLEDGEKIFVYRYSGRLEDETDMLALGRAVNGFGKNTLLFVCRADEHHAPHTVREVHPGLLVGYIDWFTIDRPDYPVNVDGWMALCGEAYQLWRSPDAAA